jgi:hypothetical protein
MTDADVNERVAVVAKLRPGSRERAAQIVAEGTPYELSETGRRRHSVFLAEDAAVFVFEGRGVEGLVGDLVNDPTRSAMFSVWGPLLQATPQFAREAFTGKPASCIATAAFARARAKARNSQRGYARLLAHTFMSGTDSRPAIPPRVNPRRSPSPRHVHRCG